MTENKEKDDKKINKNKSWKNLQKHRKSEQRKEVKIDKTTST